MILNNEESDPRVTDSTHPNYPQPATELAAQMKLKTPADTLQRLQQNICPVEPSLIYLSVFKVAF
jgi:hypothetical protein